MRRTNRFNPNNTVFCLLHPLLRPRTCPWTGKRKCSHGIDWFECLIFLLMVVSLSLNPVEYICHHKLCVGFDAHFFVPFTSRPWNRIWMYTRTKKDLWPNFYCSSSIAGVEGDNLIIISWQSWQQMRWKSVLEFTKGISLIIYTLVTQFCDSLIPVQSSLSVRSIHEA